jgi:hypothetical protein
VDVSLACLVIRYGMSHQKQGDTANPTHRLPTQLARFDPILPCEMQGVIENILGSFEAQSVLLLVDAVLGRAPSNLQSFSL